MKTPKVEGLNVITVAYSFWITGVILLFIGIIGNGEFFVGCGAGLFMAALFNSMITEAKT